MTFYEGIEFPAIGCVAGSAHHKWMTDGAIWRCKSGAARGGEVMAAASMYGEAKKNDGFQKNAVVRAFIEGVENYGYLKNNH